jgi:hypothetical protein
MKVKKEQEKVIYRCNGKVPYCKKSMCYKNKRLQTPDVCEHTSDIDYAENFVKMPGGGYYEDTSKYVLDNYGVFGRNRDKRKTAGLYCGSSNKNNRV